MIEEIQKPVRGRVYCIAICDCGKATRLQKVNLGRTQSCGCLLRDNNRIVADANFDRRFFELKMFGVDGIRRINAKKVN